MRRCNRCNVDIYGSGEVCPLCQNILEGAPCPQEDIFPMPVEDAQASRERKFLPALAVGSAGAVVVCVALNCMVPGGHWWSLFVLGGVASFWACWFLTRSKRKNVARGVVWEITAFCLLAVLWDVGTGFRRWSVNYVVPILIAFGVVVLFVLSCAGIITNDSIIFYRFLLGVSGVVPVVLLLTQITTLVIPSVICSALCALSLILTFGYEMPRLVPELKRRLHV